MDNRPSLAAFLWAIVVGMGLRIGWGLVQLVIDLAARAVRG